MSKTLSEATDEFLAYRKAAFAANTWKLSRQVMSRFIVETGNIQTRHLEPKHAERYQSHLLHKGFQPNSINNHMAVLAAFQKWALAHRYLKGPFTTTCRSIPAPVKPRLRIPSSDFPRLLNTAIRPEVRMMIALGLYAFMRSSEMNALKIADVNLDEGFIRVFVQKTQQWDAMPICAELDEELRSWMTAYALDVYPQPLRPTDFLIPAHKPVFAWQETEDSGVYRPHRAISQPSRWLNATLDKAGYPVRNDKGESLREGMHTLRRSGARAYFEALIDEGVVRDDLLRQVMAMLHHRSVLMTERYLGLEADREKRDLNLRGKVMFKRNRENVRQLEVAR